MTRNILWNFLGAGLPLLVGLVAIPPLLQGLGTDRFGVLAFGWMLVGYLSLFDLGFSRALTQLVAQRLGANNIKHIPELISTAIILVSAFGVIGAVIVWLCVPLLVNGIFRIPPELHSEARAAFYLLALSLPFVLSSTMFRAVLEAYQRFAIVNVIKALLGISMLLGPLLVLPLSNNLALAVSTIVAARMIVTIAFYRNCRKTVEGWRGYKFVKTHVRSLAKFGGWMTVSNILGPAMVSMDRFLMGILISTTAVAYYSIPYEMVTKLWIVPASTASVLFPALAASIGKDVERARMLYRRGIEYNYLILFPIVLTVVTFAKEGLNAWLGRDFAFQAALVLQLLALGVLINSLANFPFALIQANGRPDVTARIHVIELPFYLGALWLGLQYFGIVGAAFVWTARVLVDAILLFVSASRMLGGRWTTNKSLATYVTVSTLALVTPILVSVAIKIQVFAVFLVAFLYASWWIVLGKDMREVASWIFSISKEGNEE
ncbi:MAG TPA: flippase [Bryobacteraceae bacterium]|nr:flippase [Bryobacteraceae bacterium]